MEPEKEKPKVDFTFDDLLKDGWERGDDPVIAISKKIPNRNFINNSSDSDITLVCHRMYNSNTFAVLFPDGAMLNFVANKFEDLKTFERMIYFYDPAF